MPASSGAPVLFDTCTIAGVHTGALFHLDDEFIKTDQHEVSFVIVKSNMPAVIKVCLACASACYISHQCACNIMVCCCICMAAVQWSLLKIHNTGMGTAYLRHCFVNVQDAPRCRIDKDEQDMWWPQAGINAAAASHSPKRKVGTIECDQAVKGIEKMALHANANIPHKDQLATFVPWQSIHFAAHIWLGKCKARLIIC